MAEINASGTQDEISKLEVLLKAALEKVNEEVVSNIQIKAEVSALRSELNAYKIALDEAAKKISSLEANDLAESSDSNV